MTFWEITGWAILVGIACYLLCIGLDTLLHNLLERRQAKQLRNENRTADIQALGSDAVRRQYALGRCPGCGELEDNGQAHGYGAEYGGCV